MTKLSRLVSIGVLACAALAPALWTGAWADRAQRWGVVAGEMLALTIIVTAFTLRPRRRDSARAIRGAAKVKPK